MKSIFPIFQGAEKRLNLMHFRRNLETQVERQERPAASRMSRVSMAKGPWFSECIFGYGDQHQAC